MLETLLALVLVALACMAWQLLRYLRIRQDSAQDRQRPWHSGDAFHVIVFFKLRTGDKIVDTVRHFLQTIQANSKARLIYAGQTACTVYSRQLGNCDWDGVLLLEYPSRTDYQDSVAIGHIDMARLYFAESYLHGMRRNWHRNLTIPLFLLRQRAKDILCGKWRVEPLQRSPVFATFPEYEKWRNREARLRALNAINRQGLVVYSLIKRGNRQQQADNEGFGKLMGSRMAALSHGPLHMGHSVALEDLARFDQVVIVQYPSAEYYADLLASQFFLGVTGTTLVADTLAVFTIPITDHL